MRAAPSSPGFVLPSAGLSRGTAPSYNVGMKSPLVSVTWSLFETGCLLLVLTSRLAFGLAQYTPPEPKPLDRIELMGLVLDDLPGRAIAVEVEQRGLNFDPSPQDTKML